MSEKKPSLSERIEAKKRAYKLCWHCNKPFRGKHKYESLVTDRLVYVHKQCAEELKEIE